MIGRTTPLRIEADVQCWKDLRDPIPDWPDPPGITIAVATEAETMEAAEMRLRDAGEHIHTEFQDRVRRGQMCFVAKRGAEVVGCNWLAFGSDHEGPVRIALEPDEVLCMDAFTAIPARGRSIHTALQHAMIVWAKAHGYRMAHTFLLYRNRPSEMTLQRMGWRQDRWPRYVILSSPLLRQFNVRRQIVIDLAPGRHPVPRGPWLRTPPFEREPWEQPRNR